MRATSIARELQTLFWLQWKLTLAMFRSRRLADKAWIVQLLLRIVQLVFTFPVFLAMGVGLAIGLALVTPGAAFELAIVANTLLSFFWLLLPASYSSQIVERFEMSRLFHYPMSFRGILLGSAVMSLLSMTGLWTVPLLLGEIAGLAWHAPLALPLIILGALPTFALLVLTGRIVDDLFDLVAGDRRLRTIAITLMTLPFMLLWLGQYVIQFFFQRVETPPDFLAPLLAKLERAQGFSEVIEIVQPSRILGWLPSGWATSGMGLAVTGEWGRALLFLALSLSYVALLLWIHSRITRRLMDGAALSIGAERVHSRRRLNLPLPGPDSFWALMRKDWLHLQRNPIPRRLLFSSLVMLVVMGFSFIQVPFSEVAPDVQVHLPFLIALGVVVMLNLTTNAGLMGNYFGIIDREGFSGLAFSGIDRRYILASGGITFTFFVLAQYALILTIVTLLTGYWIVLPWGLFLAFCLQVSSLAGYHFAAIMGPYRMQLKFSNNQRGGNLWAMLAWITSLPALGILVVLPYFFWRPALFVTLPLAVLYSVGLYVAMLKPLAGLLSRREHRILAAITKEI